MISVIVPCYNEEEALPFFYKEIDKISNKMKDIDFEFIFVNDGSKDKTLEVLKELSKEDKRVKYISFSRNFGKEAGMYAGLENAKGDYIAIMDADLQDPPELLETMYNDIINEKYDCVGLRRVTRDGEPKLRSFFARQYYKLINKISDTNIVDGARDFRLMTRQMVDSTLELKEKNRYSKGLFAWVGYKTKWLEYKNVERVAGITKWSFYKLFKYSIDSIISFSNFPLILPIIISIIFLLVSIILFIVGVIETIIYWHVPYLITTITTITFIASVQLFFIGIIGMYLARIYGEVRKRPVYLIKETNIKK